MHCCVRTARRDGRVWSTDTPRFLPPLMNMVGHAVERFDSVRAVLRHMDYKGIVADGHVR
jgi:hypothetical protein